MLTAPAQPDLPGPLAAAYPFRTRTLTLDGLRMSFVDGGRPEAPPLLLLHGNGSWSFVYRKLIARAAMRFRVIAPDHIGFGLSEKPADAAYHTLDRHIDNLTRLVEALGLEHISLVMNGWGGPIGLGYAITQPRNLKRLVCVNSWPGPAKGQHGPRLPLGLRLATGALGRRMDAGLNTTLGWLLGGAPDEAFVFPFRGGDSRAAVYAWLGWSLRPDAATRDRLDNIYSRLRTLQAPAAILWGLKDPLVTKLPAYRLRDQLALASEPRFFGSAGGCLPEDDPEALAAAALGPIEARTGRRAEPVFKIIL